MPKPSKARTASVKLGRALTQWASARGFDGAESDGYDPAFLVACANEPVESWFWTTAEIRRKGGRTSTRVKRFEAAAGEPATLAHARELQDHLRRDLAHIAAHGYPFASSGPRTVTLQWWWDNRRRGPATLLAQASGVDMCGYFDWAMLLFWLRDAGRLTLCGDCGQFSLLKSEKHKRCGNPACASARRVASVADAKARYRTGQKLTRKTSRALDKSARQPARRNVP